MFSKYTLALALIAAFAAVVSSQDDTCGYPIEWHGKLEQNWPLAGSSLPKKGWGTPKFRMVIRGLGPNNTYTPGKSYTVTLVTVRPNQEGAPRIHGFYITLDVDGVGCTTGAFSARGGKIYTKATVKAACSDLLYNGSTDIIRSKGIKWKAPKCGCVTMSADVRTADRIIVSDEPDTDPKYQNLSKKMCPAPSIA